MFFVVVGVFCVVLVFCLVFFPLNYSQKSQYKKNLLQNGLWKVNKVPNDGLLVGIVFDLQNKREYRTNGIQETCFFMVKSNPFIFPDQSSPVTTTKQEGRGVSGVKKQIEEKGSKISC